MWDINTNDIRLFLENETNFDHNQYVLNEATKAIVTETTDGILDLELEYPIKDSKNISKLLKRRNILKCKISTTDSRGEQLFKIRNSKPNTANGSIEVYAQAIARRDLDAFNMVVDLKTAPGATRKQAMQDILNHCAKPHRYRIGNLDTNTNTNINMGMEEETGDLINFLYINGYSPRKAFLDETENSIYKAWGGEMIYNNFELNMVDERGTDHSFIIESGKNLEELEQTIDDTDLDNFVTAIMPVSSDGTYLPNHEIIYSPNHSILEGGFLKLVCDDVSLEENAPDEQQAFNVLYDQLRDRVQKKFNEGIDKLKINTTVKFVQLANTEEYKEFKILEKCEIGNNVTVKYYDPYDPEKKVYLEAVGRVLKIKFNVLTNKIEEVEIGERKKQNILSTITATVNKTSDLNDKVNANKTKIKKTAKEAKDYADASTKGLKIIMEKRADEIELSVTNEVENRVAAIKVMDGKIEEKVTSKEFQSYKDQTAEEIKDTVKKGDGFGSELTQHFNEIVATINDGTEHNVFFNSDGLGVKNGAFTIYDSRGNILLRFNTNGCAGFRSLDIEEVGKGSPFYNTLASMEEIYCDKFSCERLYIGGKNLYDYIKEVAGN